MITFPCVRVSLLTFAVCLAGIGSVQAQGFDVTATDIQVIQAIQQPNGSTPMVAGRTTYVRASMSTQNGAGTMIDGHLRVFDNGVEIPESPIYSRNGPMQPAVNSNLGNLNQTLNFVFQPPASSNLVLTVTLNPPGVNHVPEGNSSDNSFTSTPQTFSHRAAPELAYAPIDHRPGGGGVPNLPNSALIEPGVGDNFLQAITPSNDWFYHRTDAPSKLWTGNLSFSGSALLSSLNVDIALMTPRPDFLYGWVPGGLPYNGQASLGGDVSMGNTQSFRHQRTFAHEIGHNLGLSHNSFLISNPGIDVEHHLNETLGLPILKVGSLRDIMVAGLSTNQAFVRHATWNFFFNHSVFNGVSSPGPQGLSADSPVLLVTGRRILKTGAIEVSHVLELPSGVPTPSTQQSSADLRVRATTRSGLASNLWISCTGSADSCCDGDSDVAPIDAGFLAVMPLGSDPIERLTIAPMSGSAAQVELERSAAAPTVSFLSPDGSQLSSGQLRVEWAGSDPDGDELSYYLRYTNDGTRWAPLATGIRETSIDIDLSELPAFVDGQGRFQVFASDGLRTASAFSPTLKGSGTIWALGGNPPWVEVMTPDDGNQFPRGATVVLHSSGWDLEDRALSGSDITWDSDVDGPLGVGRLLAVADLSVGPHVLTVTATDSSGMMTSDSTSITILDRELPLVIEFPVTYCTAKLNSQFCPPFAGFSGFPSVSDPAPFDINATLIVSDRVGLMFYGENGRASSPFFNGLLCVGPPLRRLPPQFSGGGGIPCNGAFALDFNAIIQSGLNPSLTVGQFVNAQWWYRDTNHVDGTGVGLSNAVEFQIGL